MLNIDTFNGSKQFGIFEEDNNINIANWEILKRKLVSFCKSHVNLCIDTATYSYCLKVYASFVESLPADAKLTP